MKWLRSTILRYDTSRYIIIGCLALLLTSCATLFDPESSQESNSQNVGVINSSTTIGQVIYVINPRINGITLWFSQANNSSNKPDSKINITIYSSPEADKQLYSTAISASSIIQHSQILISIPPSLVNPGEIFYLELSSTPNVEIFVHGSLEDNYSNGQAYINRSPLNADLAFRIHYSYDWSVFKQDLNIFWGYWGLFFPIIATLWIPGYALIKLFNLNRVFPLSEQVPLSISLSLALIALIYLAGSAFNISITKSTIYSLLFIFCIMIIVASGIDRSDTLFLKSIRHPIKTLSRFNICIASSKILPFLMLIGIVLISLGIRLVMIRDLSTPAWVDSFHHGLLTRLILSTGKLPQTYLPYLDIEPTVYHPGFHSNLAFFIELSGLSIPQGMLIFGQVLNALGVASVYLLAKSLTQSNTASLSAALITGTFTPMPAYYTSWGRYPQIAGLIILSAPIALILSPSHPARSRKEIGIITCSAISLAGMFIVHYRVEAFLACLFLACFLAAIIWRHPDRKQFLKTCSTRVVLSYLLAGAIISWWLLPALRFTFLPRISPSNTEEIGKLFSDFSWHYLTPALGKQTIILAAFGWLWSILRKHKIALIIPSWIVLMFFLANLDALKLPGGRFINNSSVSIMLFMPISVMAGYLFDQANNLWKSILPKRWNKLPSFVLISIALSSSVYGARQLVTIINPITILTRKADIAALAWVDQNIPDEKTIIINPFSWGYGVFAGADGGAWIPALTGNPTLPPPVLYGLGSSTQIKNINSVSEKLMNYSSSPEELWRFLSGIHVEYIYIGARGGLLSPTALISNSHYEVLYHVENTWVIHLLP